MNEKSNIENEDNIKRVLNLKRVNNTIDLTGSYVIIDNEISEESYESEIIKVTFTAQIQRKEKSVDLFLSCNEMICEDDIENLKKELGIEISGDGSFIKVISCQTDFTIQFDQENTTFIASEKIKNGRLVFKKIS